MYNTPPASSGVYTITNIINGKYYVGSSNNIKRRWRHHKDTLRRGIHPNKYLQRAFDKYGEDNFLFEIVELTEEYILKEQEILDRNFEATYNIAIMADAPMTGKKHAEKVKKLLSKKLSGKNHPHYGKPVDIEWRRKISLKKKKRTDEEEIQIYNRWKSGETKNAIAKSLGCHPTTIKRVIDRVEKFCYHSKDEQSNKKT
jgi:group I intron endonuclease